MKKKVKHRIVLAARVSMSFVAAVMICAGLFAEVSYFTMCDAGFAQDQLHKTDYVEYLTREMNQALEYYAGPSGFDEEFFGETLTMRDVNVSVSESILSSFRDGKKYIPSDTVYKNVVYSKMTEQVMAETGEVSEETDAALMTLAEKCNEVYTDYISSLYISQFGIIMHKLSGYLFFGGIVLLILGIGILLAIMKICKRHRTRRYYIYLTGVSAGVMMAVFPAVLLIGRFTSRLSIASESLYYGIKGYTNTVLWCYIVVGVACILLTQIFTFACKKSLEEKRKKSNGR